MTTTFALPLDLTALMHRAIARGDARVLTAALLLGATLRQPGMAEALMRSGDPALMQLYCRHLDPTLSHGGFTPLAYAITHAQRDIAQLLLAQGTVPRLLGPRMAEYTTRDGYTSHLGNIAVRHGMAQVVQALLGAGFDPLRADHAGRNMLRESNGNLDMLALIAEHATIRR